MSKIWRLLRSTQSFAACSATLTGAVLCVVICASVANRTDSSSCSIPAVVGKQQEGTRRSHGCSSWTALGSLALRWHRSC